MSEVQLKTPVAFLIFNRPDTTEKVFEAIRQAKPPKLLVVADGPRANKPGEAEKCAAARAIINRVDWNCEVLTNYSEKNLGCKKRVSSGLNWVFSEVEEAIILEDDCLPTQSFFNFCERLLCYYRNNEKIMHICGTNFQPYARSGNSYYFSKYVHIWGWASWRRAWMKYDVEMKTWSNYKKTNLINSVCQDIYQRRYWFDRFDEAFYNLIDTWDYQWIYACWSQNGLSIIPEANLVSNIGFRSDATHSLDENSYWANFPVKDIWDLRHPEFIEINQEADQYIADYMFAGKAMKEADTNFCGYSRQRLGMLKRKIKIFMQLAKVNFIAL